MQRFTLFLCAITVISSAIIPASAPPSSTITREDPTQCISQQCPNQFDACQKNSKCSTDAYDCYDKCFNDQECWRTCANDASMEPTLSVMSCALRFNCFDDNIFEPVICINENCTNEYNACPTDPDCQPTLSRCYT